MKNILAATAVLTSVLVAGGCATKKYVRTTSAPIQAKVDQVSDQTAKQGTAIEETRKDLKSVEEKAETGISAAKERAMSAETRANEAMSKANQAGDAAGEARKVADKANQDLNALRQVVSNIDDYKLHGETTINFGFDKYNLSDEAKQQLDNLVAEKSKMKRFFIAVEGFTDRSGSPEYNAALSRRRADKVVQYLVTKHEVPIYRIHMIGLGKDKPVDEGRNRAARAKNRRVEVKIFSADEAMGALSQVQQR